MSEPRILVFAGSIRTGSLNETLAAYMVRQFREIGADVTHASLKDYSLPIFNQDIEASEGTPQAATAFARLMAEHHGILVITPEYNAGVTPLLKNTIDWASRTELRMVPFQKRIFALGAASNGVRGGYRSLLHMRHVLELGCSAMVQPEMISVAQASKVYDESGDITDERTARTARSVAETLLGNARRFS